MFQFFAKCAGANLANINETTIEEISSLEPAHNFTIQTGTYTAEELITFLNNNLRSFKLELTHQNLGNQFQEKYKCVLRDPTLAQSEFPKLRLSHQLAFKLGFLHYHLAIKQLHKEINTIVEIIFDTDYYLDAYSHLSYLSLVSSGTTFNFNKIARVSLSSDQVQGLILGSRPFVTFELNNNWNGITIKNPDLKVCKIQLRDMLNCNVCLYFIEVVIEFNKTLGLK